MTATADRLLHFEDTRVARNYLIAGNWKMNLTKSEATALASGLQQAASSCSDVQVAIFPPYVYLECVLAAAGSIKVGSQNVSEQPNGALTGEISTDMLLDLGASMVILGHSERRSIMGESSQVVNAKTRRCLEAGLTPVVCVGETLEEREAGNTMSVVLQQCQESLAELTQEDMAKIVIAYEPVWAIGTGKVATPEQAEEVHAGIRTWLQEQYGSEIAESLQILYGGSVKPDNASQLLGQPNIDGALVGGASLKVDSFAGIIEAAAGLPVA